MWQRTQVSRAFRNELRGDNRRTDSGFTSQVIQILSNTTVGGPNTVAWGKSIYAIKGGGEIPKLGIEAPSGLVLACTLEALISSGTLFSRALTAIGPHTIW